MKTYKNSALLVIYSLMLSAFGIMLIIYSEQVGRAVKGSVERCLNVVIPALFVFMALSGIIIKSGIYSLLSKPFVLLSKRVLKMPQELFSIFLISNIAGYPIGARLLSELIDEGRINRSSAQFMLCCCFGAGPSFLSSVIGLSLYGSVRIGLIVFLSCFLSNLIIAFVVCRLFRPEVSKDRVKISFKPEYLTDCVISAGRSLFLVCAMIIFFSAFTCVLRQTGFFELFGSKRDIIASLFEITDITILKRPPLYLLPYICAICSFGGICVLLQVYAMVGQRFSFLPFLLSRPVAAVLSGLNCLWVSKQLLPKALEAASYDQAVFVKVYNFIPSICLILMIFMLEIKKGVEISR